MQFSKIFIMELFSKNTVSSSTVAARNIPALSHKLRYNPVENALLIRQSVLSSFEVNIASFSGAQTFEIFASFWSFLPIEFDFDSKR